MGIEKRLQNIEDKLNIDKEMIVVELIDFSGVPLPPDNLENGILIKHVAYESYIRS